MKSERKRRTINDVSVCIFFSSFFISFIAIRDDRCVTSWRSFFLRLSNLQANLSIAAVIRQSVVSAVDRISFGTRSFTWTLHCISFSFLALFHSQFIHLIPDLTQHCLFILTPNIAITKIRNICCYIHTFDTRLPAFACVYIRYFVIVNLLFILWLSHLYVA